MSRNKYKQKSEEENREKGGRRPKKNNRHAIGGGNGKFGKKMARIKRIAEWNKTGWPSHTKGNKTNKS